MAEKRPKFDPYGVLEALERLDAEPTMSTVED